LARQTGGIKCSKKPQVERPGVFAQKVFKRGRLEKGRRGPLGGPQVRLKTKNSASVLKRKFRNNCCRAIRKNREKGKELRLPLSKCGNPLLLGKTCEKKKKRENRIDREKPQRGGHFVQWYERIKKRKRRIRGRLGQPSAQPVEPCPKKKSGPV